MIYQAAICKYLKWLEMHKDMYQQTYVVRTSMGSICCDLYTDIIQDSRAMGK